MLDMSNSQKVKGAVGGLQLLVRHWFIPEDVTPDYYHFTLWRMFQRFVAGTVNVFGTQVCTYVCVCACIIVREECDTVVDAVRVGGDAGIVW